MQDFDYIKPLFLNLDTSLTEVKNNEGIYIKDIGFDINKNPGNIGTGEGQNMLTLTPTRSNEALEWSLPEGFNKNVGTYYSETTNETYVFNFNSNGNHCIGVIYGSTKIVQTVIVDPQLNFTDNPDGYMADHRVSLRTIMDKNGKIVEKILVTTDGNSWQKWILVNTAISTNGFDASLYPYWTLQPPHFDRRELIEWAVRKPMYNPSVSILANTIEDGDKINQCVDKAFQFAWYTQNTDGRISTLSPYSEPLIFKSEDYLSNPDNLPKNGQVEIYAGSPLTEVIFLCVRRAELNKNSIPSIVEWTDWYLYDTLYKFGDSQTSSSEVIGTKYWLRTNPWAQFSYDPVFNTIKYKFDNSRVPQIIDQSIGVRLQDDIPQQSRSMSDLGDAMFLANNRREYSNLPTQILNKLDFEVIEKPSETCNIPTRKIRLYAYIGRGGNEGWYTSQVGWHNGQDSQMRWGGLDFGGPTSAAWNPVESTTFGLDFADRDAFRCYLKGTPYYADGQWFQVNSDFTLVKIQSLLDFSNNDVLEYVRNVYTSNGFFVCVFDFLVPSGRYIASIGRHNVLSTGDYRNTSTYVYGIANSRNVNQINADTRTLRPTSIIEYSKEYEVDCTSGDIDVWGNGIDIFYIYCPFISNIGNKQFRFFEGYLQESASNPIGVELFPYTVSNVPPLAGGIFTDKNGFYWAYASPPSSHNVGQDDIQITNAIVNCGQNLTFLIQTAGGNGWRPNPPAYLSDHNGGVVGDCNRVLLNGKITNIDGSIGYSNISVSIKDGATTYSRSDGAFTLIIHNGLPQKRVSNVYTNAGGNYLITLQNCGYLPLFQYNENLAACINCQPRVYPIPLNYAIFIQDTAQVSLKEGGRYSLGCLVSDLAGRLSFVNGIKEMDIPTFMQRQDVLATYFRLLINSGLQLNSFNPDIAWFCPVISKNLNEKRYIQWVGDSIKYIDNTGNVVSDPASAIFCSIAIDSLYDYNVSRNFSLLANYQFTPGDRIRFIDDGNGSLLSGNPIDLQILGTNYNQAAMNAGLIPNNSTVPIVNDNTSSQTTVSVTNANSTPVVTTLETQQNAISITLYVLFDARLSQLLTRSGFWIELYTPAQESDILRYKEIKWYPVIQGEPCEYIGISGGQPQYNFFSNIDLNYWDTYLFPRNITIPDVGDRFFSHPFESSNISDNWGADIDSGGRQNVKNDQVKQQWYVDEGIKSDDFVSQGILNGLGSFDATKNTKTFKDFKSGGIVAVKSLRNLVSFICENNYFITDYNFQYIYANAQGIQVANLENNLGSPHQKIGDNFGVAYEDTQTVIFYDKFIFWYDYKNEAWVECNWQSAVDVTKQALVSSYFNKKTQFIKEWNNSVSKEKMFDVFAGVDHERENVYITFRPRRNNSNNVLSYINNRRGIDVAQQETIVFNITNRRFTRFQSFTPEGYAILKGSNSGLEMISFQAGKPYVHNNTNNGFCNFYGQQQIPCFTGVFNKEASIIKILQNISLDVNPIGYYVDEIYSEEPDSFSYIPFNYFKKQENQYYAPVLRNMVSYPQLTPNSKLVRSTLVDAAGKRVFGRWFVVRFIFDENEAGAYNEMKGVYYQITNSVSVKK